MSASLLQLMEELLQAIDQRNAGDPDAPAWEASHRIGRLEAEIAERLSAAGTEREVFGTLQSQGRSEEATAVIA